MKVKCDSCGKEMKIRKPQSELFCVHCGGMVNLPIPSEKKSRKKLWIILGSIAAALVVAIIVLLLCLGGGEEPTDSKKKTDSGSSHTSHEKSDETSSEVTPVPESLPTNDIIKIRRISGGSVASLDYYEGYVMEISDPSWVRLGIPKDFGAKGQKLPRLIESYGAIAGINGGGFADVGGFGNGGNAVGMVMVDGVMIKEPVTSEVNLIGFNEDNVLVLGKYKTTELESLNLRCACEFAPFLIINGQPAEIHGDGGWGSAPRTAIGQRKDGTVIMVVIDGRNPPVIGATMKQLQQILIDEGCWNAANLDGGSASVMYYTNKAGNTEEGIGRVVNNPSGADADGMRFLPNAFLVVDPKTYNPPKDRVPYIQ